MPSIKGGKIQLTKAQQETVLKEAAPHIDYLYKEFGLSIPKERFVASKSETVSESTIDFTARKLLEISVPEFVIPKENASVNEGGLDSWFILKTVSMFHALNVYSWFRLRIKHLVIRLGFYKREGFRL